jgi:hypothetical protein
MNGNEVGDILEKITAGCWQLEVPGKTCYYEGQKQGKGH